MNEVDVCCAECGKEEDEGGVVNNLKACKGCMLVKYCNVTCQKKHWSTHKSACKKHAAELRDEALFKDPPPKEDCPICCLPMPVLLISFVSLPPATISSVPINDYANANKELAKSHSDHYYSCCGKSICGGCVHSFQMTGNDGKCPFCNSERGDKSDEERVEEMRKRVAANDANSICELGGYYNGGAFGLQQDRAKAVELYARAAELDHHKANYNLADVYHEGGNLKKAKFHYEAAAMAGDDVSRCNLGVMEARSGNMERAIKHWKIAASAGHFRSMNNLRILFQEGRVSRETIDSILAAYNSSCAEMRSKPRDVCVRRMKILLN
jgi:TPR repeat protein